MLATGLPAPFLSNRRRKHLGSSRDETTYMTPIIGWPFGEHSFSNDVAVIPAPDIQALRLESFGSISSHELETIQNHKFWMAITCSRDLRMVDKGKKVDTLVSTIQSLQIISPVGWSGILAGRGESSDENQFDHLNQFLFCSLVSGRQT